MLYCIIGSNLKQLATKVIASYTPLLRQLNDILVNDAPRSGRNWDDVMECLIKYNNMWRDSKKEGTDYCESNPKSLASLPEVMKSYLHITFYCYVFNYV
jgi:hypothetical protein